MLVGKSSSPMDGWGVSGVSCDVFSSVEHLRIPKQRPQESIIVDVQSLHEKLRDRCCVADFFFLEGECLFWFASCSMGIDSVAGGVWFSFGVCVCVSHSISKGHQQVLHLIQAGACGTLVLPQTTKLRMKVGSRD